MLNLSGRTRTLQAEGLHKLISESVPIVFWVGNMMGVEITSCATKLSREGDLFQQPELLLNAYAEDADLFA